MAAQNVTKRLTTIIIDYKKRDHIKFEKFVLFCEHYLHPYTLFHVLVNKENFPREKLLPISVY